MRETVSDEKNACRKVKRVLAKRTDLDAEMYYSCESVVPTSDKSQEMHYGSGHYSKHNVDRREKRANVKVSKYKAEVSESKKRAQNAVAKLAKAQV
jgi:hypothetical protein